jgi:bacillithiol biosynthesis cysteine-adding enzyme BshC
MQAQQFPDLEYRNLDALVRAYCTAHPSIAELFEVNPTVESISDFAKQRPFSDENYRLLTEVLRRQYDGYSFAEAVNANLQAFSEKKAVTVCTGHQLCLMGGPAYLIYKIISTIKLGQSLQAHVGGRKVVPVFWLASEDHDKEEIDHTYLSRTELKWNTNQSGAVGRFTTDGFDEVLTTWLASIDDEDLRSRMERMWTKAMAFKTWSQLTKSWIHDCFSEWGLIVIDADDAQLKRALMPVVMHELLHSTVKKSVEASNEILSSNGFRAQVNPRDINVFYLQKGYRARIERHQDGWHTADRVHSWDAIQLAEEVEKHPENFSPNVLLRPVYQEIVLPNVAYVGGPGELAYWLQLRDVFRSFQVSMPALVLRDAAIILSQSISRKLAKLSLSNAQILAPKEAAILKLIGDKPDFTSEKNSLAAFYDELANKVASTDASLRAIALAEAKRAQSAIEQLQAKLWKSVKLREEQKLNALAMIWDEVYPNGSMQERVENVLALACANDKELIRLLLLEFQAPQSTLVLIEI